MKIFLLVHAALLADLVYLFLPSIPYHAGIADDINAVFKALYASLALSVYYLKAMKCKLLVAPLGEIIVP